MMPPNHNARTIAYLAERGWVAGVWLPVPKVARWMGWWLVAIAVACNAAHVLRLRPDWLLVPVLSGFPVSLAVLVLTLRAMREGL
jgi:hypothetical protein